MRTDWEPWLEALAGWQEERRKARRMRIERHSAWVEKLSARAGGGAGMSHSITDSSPWRNGVQVIQHVYQAAQPYGRITGRWIFQSKIWLTSRVTMKFARPRRSEPAFRHGGTQEGGKQLQCEHRSGNRCFSSKRYRQT